ncbi:MAG: (2Fe-2S)-binding protein [Leptospirales bacterium]|nr:(2Fe-2S)-binding protein [Leptospirales bacterium]
MDQAALNALLRPRMVCICRRVSEERIRQVVEAGASTFERVQELTDCSTNCGTCELRVRELIEKFRG